MSFDELVLIILCIGIVLLWLTGLLALHCPLMVKAFWDALSTFGIIFSLFVGGIWVLVKIIDLGVLKALTALLRLWAYARIFGTAALGVMFGLFTCVEIFFVLLFTVWVWILILLFRALLRAYRRIFNKK